MGQGIRWNITLSDKLGQVLVEGTKERACSYLLVQVFGNINIKEFENFSLLYINLFSREKELDFGVSIMSKM